MCPAAPKTDCQPPAWLQQTGKFLQRLLQKFRVGAARLRHVGAAAPFASDNGGDLSDDLSGMVALGEVLGDEAKQHGLVFNPAAEEDYARTEALPQLVAEITERFRIGCLHD